MTISRIRLAQAASGLVLLGTCLVAPAGASEGSSVVEEGKGIAFSRSKGNCLACHMIEGGESPGNLGPPLIAMKARYPDKAKLRAQIWDATTVNPDSAMVPFGLHRVLTEEEIDKLVEYVWTL
ncbi:MAG: sulfur oxidation c-type cytochrome SoxX [Gammaproteobacteria bacterium]|nr:sulfur oxidation c-type cytochrome SoxX [Gammaproteobacteria bacterium]